MAILKHIASKSSNYGAALEYLIFKHDELRKKPILDKNGNRIMRDEFYLDGLNCEPYSFDAACQQLNREYITKYEEARQFLKQDFLDEKFPLMKDLRDEKELLMRTKDARYETYHYFKERNAEIQTVLANVDSILEMEKVQQRERQPKRKKRSYDMSL